MKKALFFDLDGTLWDGLIPLIESYNETMKKLGKDYRFDLATIKTFMGLTPVETAQRGFGNEKEEEALKLFYTCVKDEIEFMKTHPGAMYPDEEMVLEKLSQKYPLYIISNCCSGYIENYLNALNMNKYFKGHTCIGDTGLEKYQNILLMKEKEQIDDVIYIGDTLKDKIESEKAGVKFIHAAYGFGKIEEDEFFVNSFIELIDKVEEVFSI